MSTRVEASTSRADRHRTAVKNSLRLAGESAARGDYADALGWIAVLESIGEQLPQEYQAKRRAWQEQLTEKRVARVRA